MARNYSDEEVEAIFRRALERQLEGEDGFAHDELIAAAREVGLGEDAIERAVHEIESERGDEAIIARLQRKSRDGWLRHLTTYLVIAGGFLGMHALGYVGVWAIWMAFGWGMGMALHTFGVVRGPTEERVAKEKSRLNRAARRKAMAEARREAKQRKAEEISRRGAGRSRHKGAGDELERVIEEGVTLLLTAAAKKLQRATAPIEKAPRTEFEHYVADQKKARGVVVTPPPARDAPGKTVPRARVELDEAQDAELDAPAQRRRRSRQE